MAQKQITGRQVDEAQLDASLLDGASIPNVDAVLLNGKAAGTGAGDIVALDGSGRLPPVSGELLTNVGYSPLSISASTGTNRNLVIGDAGNLITASNANPNTITIPTNASVPFDIGTEIVVVQLGAGQTTIVGPGVTLAASDGLVALASQYSTATLIKIAVDTWLLVGDFV